MKIQKYLLKYSDNIDQVEGYDEYLKSNNFEYNLHHRLETHNSDGEPRLIHLSRNELKALDMYYHRPPEELIFLPVRQHQLIHTQNSGRWKKGHQPWNKDMKMGKQPKEVIERRAKKCYKPVMCIETGEIFPSVKSVGSTLVTRALKNPNYTYKGCHWKYI